MIRQLIFTSAPMGLEPGRSGYCTVTRDRSLSQRLVREIERISVLDFSVAGGQTPKVAAFRFLHVGSTEVYLLSRIRSSGQDYTKRTNYIGHHLVIDPREIAGLPSPAQILAHWDGWRDEWSENPRYLDESSSPDLSSCDIESSDRAINWFQWAGDEHSAELPKSGKSIFRTQPGDEERLLLLFAETAAQFDSPEHAWEMPFTNFLQTNEDAADFTWIGGWPDSQVDGLEIAKGTNFFDLEPYDEEMAALELPPIEEPVVEPVPEMPEVSNELVAAPGSLQADVLEEIASIEPEPEIEEVVESVQPALAETPPPMPQEPPPMPAPREEEVQPDPIPFHEPEVESKPESITEAEPVPEAQIEPEPEEEPEPVAALERSDFVKRSVKRRRSRIPRKVLLSLAACMSFVLGGVLCSLFGRLDDLPNRFAGVQQVHCLELETVDER